MLATKNWCQKGFRFEVKAKNLERKIKHRSFLIFSYYIFPYLLFTMYTRHYSTQPLSLVYHVCILYTIIMTIVHRRRQAGI